MQQSGMIKKCMVLIILQSRQVTVDMGVDSSGYATAEVFGLDQHLCSQTNLLQNCSSYLVQ